MTFKPGESGNPAGKPPGTQNRNRLARRALVEMAPVDFDPVEFMMAVASGQPIKNFKSNGALRLLAAKEAAKYLHPQLKQTEAKVTVRDERTPAEEAFALPGNAITCGICPRDFKTQAEKLNHYESVHPGIACPSE